MLIEFGNWIFVQHPGAVCLPVHTAEGKSKGNGVPIVICLRNGAKIKINNKNCFALFGTILFIYLLVVLLLFSNFLGCQWNNEQRQNGTAQMQ